MVISDFLDCIVRFQTLIAGVLVFLGVFFTLAFNAWLARNERRESLKLERQAIRTALIEELKIVKMSLVDGIEKIEQQKDSTGAMIPNGTMSDIYKTLLPRIGLLTPIQVEKVLFAYMSAIQFRENLTLPQGATSQEHHIYLPHTAFDAFVNGLRNLTPHIDEAILSLSEPNVAEIK